MIAATESRPQVLHSRDAEQAILGALLVNNASLDRVADLTAEHFFNAEHRAIFDELRAQIAASKPADVITVHEGLTAAGHDVPLSYLSDLWGCIPTAAGIMRHAGIVREFARARALLAAASRASELAYDHSRPIAERIDEVAGELTKMLEETVQREAVGISQSLAEHIDVIERRAAGEEVGIATGLHDLDEMLSGGLQPGDLFIIGARPSHGKTACGLTMAMRIAETKPVGVLSMEMSRSQLNDRATAALGHVPLNKIQRPPTQAEDEHFWGKVCDAIEEARALRLYIDDQGGLNLSQIRAKVRSMRRRFAIEVLVLDYLQLVVGRDPKQPRAYQLAEVTSGLKALAKEMGLAIIALAQVNRNVDGMPTLPDLKDSGAIEQDADIVMFLHRPFQDEPALGESFRYFARAFVAKARQGRTGLFPLSYIGNETRFASWSGPEPQKPAKPGSRKGNDL